jgi:NAD(P)-dependent dehydrogenase (short-subunit alcohol dehydrogenase family)
MTTSPYSPSNVFDVQGRRALVTGASGGIGRAIALGLVQAGVNVVGAARSEDKLKALADECTGASGTFDYIATDLRDPESAERCVVDAATRLGGLDILVNNAGDDHDSKIEDTELATFQRIIDLNLQSVWVMTRAASAYLRDGGGKVINIASVLGLKAMLNDSCYIASKHGVVGLTKAIGLEWARKGVQVNAICPGFVQTDMIPNLIDENGEENDVAAYIRRKVPAARWAVPEEFVGPTIFLASHASDYMTGQVVVIDGGGIAQ